MQIREVRLSGFKSFADPTGLEIAPGITGIVGPNGCGKSNIVEAVLWAMGETAPSSVRSSEMEDVIFAGGGRRLPHSRAEVTLLVDANGTTIPGESTRATDVEISRRVQRQAGSTFRINGREVRGRDFQTLFGDAGTGARSCSIVRQNRIGELVNAKPTARRQVLEDAAGIAGLHKRRHEAELRINATRRNLELVEESLKQLDGQLRSFKRESRRAGRYRGISARLRRTECLLAYSQWLAEREARAKAERTLALAETQTAHNAAQATAAARQRTEAATLVPPLRQAQIEATAAHVRITSEAEEIERRHAAAAERLAAAEKHLTELQVDLARERDLEADAVRKLEELGPENPDNGKADETALRTRLDAAQKAAADHHARTLEAEAEWNRRSAAAAASESRQQHLEAGAADAASQFARLDAELERIAESRIATRSRHDQAREEHTAARARETEATARSMAARAVLDRAEAEHAAAETEARTASIQHQEARRSASALEAEQAATARLLANPAGGDAPTDAPKILTCLRPAAGFEAALGAALADDLQYPEIRGTEASGWLTLPPLREAPALPENVPSLAEQVDAPAALTRRLSLTGIVSRADGDRIQPWLRPGQRLVSREGDLWRWDGLRLYADTAARAAGAWLEARARLEVLDREITGAREEVARAAAIDREVEDARTTTRAAVAAARAALEAADAAVAEATRDAERAAAAIHLTDTEFERLQLDETRATKSRAELQSRLEGLRTAVAEADSPEVIADRRQAAHDALERARTKERNAQATLHDLQRQLDVLHDQAAGRQRARTDWSARRDAARTRIQALEERIAASKNDIRAERQEPGQQARQIEETAAACRAAADARTEATNRLAEAEAALQSATDHERATSEAHAQSREHTARCQADAETAIQRAKEAEAGLRSTAGCAPAEVPKLLDVDAAQVGSPADYASEIAMLRTERDRLGAVNLRAEADMREVVEARDALCAEKADLDGALEKFADAIQTLNRDGRDRLREAFARVDRNFQEVFGTLFGDGASASLALIDSGDPFEAGLEIYAQPPGKKLLSLAQMSGGEKALTALALVFALFLSSPSPLCVLDEVDAPLDDANVQRFCDLLDDLTARSEARFLVITHHAITISRMDRLYGVTMAEKGVSQLVSVDYGQALERIAA